MGDYFLPAVQNSDGQRGAVDILLRQLHVQVLHHVGEVGVLLGVDDHGALYNVAPALDVNSRMIDWQELDLLQIPESPEQNLKSVLDKLRSDVLRDRHDRTQL